MAHRAVLVGGDVIATLALGGAAVMAALAVAGDAGVIEIGGSPTDSGVAHHAVLVGD